VFPSPGRGYRKSLFAGRVSAGVTRQAVAVPGYAALTHPALLLFNALRKGKRRSLENCFNLLLKIICIHINPLPTGAILLLAEPQGRIHLTCSAWCLAEYPIKRRAQVNSALRLLAEP
jgi:hypothetical protein